MVSTSSPPWAPTLEEPTKDNAKFESKEAGKHRGESRSRASSLSDASNSDVATDDNSPGQNNHYSSSQPFL